jgi:hypothetical protein
MASKLAQAVASNASAAHRPVRDLYLEVRYGSQPSQSPGARVCVGTLQQFMIATGLMHGPRP